MLAAPHDTHPPGEKMGKHVCESGAAYAREESRKLDDDLLLRRSAQRCPHYRKERQRDNLVAALECSESTDTLRMNLERRLSW